VVFENYLDSGKKYTLDIEFSLTAWEDYLNPPIVGHPDRLIAVDILDFDMDLFLREKSAWKEQNLQHYQFVTRQDSDRHVQVVVSPGKAPQRTPSWVKLVYGKTISEVYATIEDDIKKLQVQVKMKPPEWSYKIVVKYDTEYHYPIQYSIIIGEPEDFIDGGLQVMEISDFKILEE
jgi:hypothetical protein